MTERTEKANWTKVQFDRLSQLARKALCLYDDQGLLQEALLPTFL